MLYSCALRDPNLSPGKSEGTEVLDLTKVGSTVVPEGSSRGMVTYVPARPPTKQRDKLKVAQKPSVSKQPYKLFPLTNSKSTNGTAAPGSAVSARGSPLDEATRTRSGPALSTAKRAV